MHSFTSYCIRVASAAEGAVFEVIAAPQEQPTQAQEERCEHPAQGPSDPSAHPINFKIMTPIYVFISYALRLRVV